MKIEEIKNGNMNEVYLLTTDEDKYIVRTSDFDNSFECKVLKILEKHSFNCPKIITNFKLDSKNIMIYKYLEGDNPEVYDDLFFEKMAKLLVKLHEVEYKNLYKASLTNEENLEKLSEYYTGAIESKYLKADKDFITELYERVIKIDFTKLDKCIVHSDIKRENMVQNDNELYLIDFGNCYIGTRLIDVIRVIMWFFIKNENYDYKQMNLFANSYFSAKGLNKNETEIIDELLIFCILYNLLKDVYLNGKGILTANYVENNSLKWLTALKDQDRILKIGEVIKNAKGFAKRKR